MPSALNSAWALLCAVLAGPAVDTKISPGANYSVAEQEVGDNTADLKALQHNQVKRGRSRDHAWLSRRVLAITDSLREVLRGQQQQWGLREEEIEQALRWASYPIRITVAQVVVYANKDHANLRLLQATSPFPVNIVRLSSKWVGTLDKLAAYRHFLETVDDQAILIFCDGFDVFGNGFDGHELLRRYFAFNRPIVVATEENLYPREVGDTGPAALDILSRLGHLNIAHPSRFVNAGGVIGTGWALKRMHADIWEHMVANDPENLMKFSDYVGHWFLHAYDQFELWSFFIRHVFDVYADEVELLIALDTEQWIFGSTVMLKENWPILLKDSKVINFSIDVDVPLVFDADQSLFEIQGCRARFVGRQHFPIFWHGQGPIKTAWEALRDRLAQRGCFSD